MKKMEKPDTGSYDSMNIAHLNGAEYGFEQKNSVFLTACLE